MTKNTMTLMPRLAGSLPMSVRLILALVVACLVLMSVPGESNAQFWPSPSSSAGQQLYPARSYVGQPPPPNAGYQANQIGGRFASPWWQAGRESPQPVYASPWSR
jgi:hypothetical protein